MTVMPNYKAFILFLLCAGFSQAQEVFDYHTIRGREAKGSLEGLYEGELLPRKSKNMREQGMRHYGPGWSGNSHLLWHGEFGDSIKTTIHFEEAGPYQVELRMTKAGDYGVCSIILNGKVLKEKVDLYSTKVELTPVINLGKLDLKAGDQQLEFKLTESNPKARPFRKNFYILGLDYIKFKSLKPPKKLTPKKIEKVEPEVLQKDLTLEKLQPLLNSYCINCHGGEKTKGRINLKEIHNKQGFLSNIKVTEKVYHALALSEMPPEDEKQPTTAERQQLTQLFRQYLDEHLKSNSQLKPTVMRRLNRYEYSNAVKDLLDLKGPVYPLPEIAIRAFPNYFNPASGKFPDSVRVGNRALGKNQVEQKILRGVVPFAIDLQAEHGFNNRGEELSISPIFLESIVKLSRSIVTSPDFNNYTRLYNSLFTAPKEASIEEQKTLGEKRLLPLLERAFRQRITDSIANRYINFFQRELDRTKSFESSMKSVIAGILASPRFIYIVESKREASEKELLSPYELAARLSFFLWSSIPDKELIKSARSGRLTTPSELKKQVERMIEDPKCQSLSQNFARQWLRLDQLITAVPDFDRFQTYYARIGCEQWKFGLQTMLEPLLLFESIMVEDRSIMLLVDSKYSYRTDEMESWYQDKVPFKNKGNRNRFNTFNQVFRKRSLSSRREGGIATTAATLTMTSSPLRTSPIIRGAWVATVLLNRPPPPPPDVVPEIEADDRKIEEKGLTIRERLKEHQENQSCASCHDKIDPLGFALESYDAVGRWRDQYSSGLKIDSSGKLFGKDFKDVIGLKNILLQEPQYFMRAFSEHLLSYALGRELALSDKPAVDLITKRVLAEHGKFSTVVLEITKSYPFLYKTNQQEPEK